MDDPDGVSYLSTRARFLIAFALAIASLTAAHLFFTPQYRTNDDIGMSFIMEGVALTPEPTPYVLYAHAVVGYLVCGLLKVAPGFPWFRTVMLTVQVLASTSIYECILRGNLHLRDPRKRVGSITVKAIVLMVVLLAVDIPLYIKPQFTLMASHAGVAAMAVWIYWAAQRKATPLVECMRVVFLFALSAFIRFESAAMVLGISIAASFVLSLAEGFPFRKFNLRRQIARYSLLATLIVVFFASYVSNVMIYSSHTNGWEEVMEYNHLKCDFIDFPRIKYTAENKEVFDEIGWSATDFEMFVNWYWVDREKFSIDKLRYIDRHAKKVSGAPTPVSFSATFSDIWNSDLGIVLLIALALVTSFCRFGDVRTVAYFAVVASAFAIAVALIVSTNRFPPRVYYSFFNYVVVIGAVLAGDQGLRFGRLNMAENERRFRRYFDKLGSSRSIKIIASFWCWETPMIWLLVRAASPVVFAIVALNTIVYESNAHRQFQESCAQALAELERSDSDLFVLWGAEFPHTSLPPFVDRSSLADLNIIPIGTCSRFPTNYQRMDEFGIDNLALAVCERDDVHLLSHDGAAIRVAQYVSENFGVHYGRVLEGHHVYRKMYNQGYEAIKVFSFVRIDEDGYVPIEHPQAIDVQ